jgi:hypothetical protein
MHYAVNAALDAIERWLVAGVQPPSGPRFQLSGSSLARDANGNALGGIRLAPIEHPVASYSLDGLARSAAPRCRSPRRSCSRSIPRTPDYACQMRETTYQNVKDGFLLEEDAEGRCSARRRRGQPLADRAGRGGLRRRRVPDDVDNCPLVPNSDQPTAAASTRTRPTGSATRASAAT